MLRKVEVPFGHLITLERFLGEDEDERKDIMFWLVYESNMIEDIYIDHVGTVVESQEPPRPPEVFDHYDALQYVYKKKDEVLSLGDVEKIHVTLMKNLMKSAGKYREVSVRTGRFGKPLPEFVPILMKEFEDKQREIYLGKPRIDEILESHFFFEIIHPFLDGNGRTGRLLLNWNSLNSLGAFYKVEKAKQKDYFAAIRKYEEEFKLKRPGIEFSPGLTEEEWETLILEKFVKRY